MASSLLRTLLAATALFAASAPAFAQQRRPPAEAEEEQNYIEIPGVGRMVLPPGVHGYPQPEPRAPSVAEREPGVLPAPRPPEPPLSAAQAQAKMLDALMTRLKSAADGPETQAVAALARAAFAHAPSDTLALIAQRAAIAEAAGAPQLAVTLLDRAIALAPGWAEAFVRRAQLRLAAGDPLAARADLDAALRLEPRRFDALAAEAALLEEVGDKKGALAAYRRALNLVPKQETLRQNEERLRLEIEGRDI